MSYKIRNSIALGVIILLVVLIGGYVTIYFQPKQITAKAADHDLDQCDGNPDANGDERRDKGKPDPEPFLLAAHALGLAPHRCVVIEDTPGGVQAAKAAGMACVAVTHSCPRDSLVGADLVVDDLAAVPLAAVLADGGPRDPILDAG